MHLGRTRSLKRPKELHGREGRQAGMSDRETGVAPTAWIHWISPLVAMNMEQNALATSTTCNFIGSGLLSTATLLLHLLQQMAGNGQMLATDLLATIQDGALGTGAAQNITMAVASGFKQLKCALSVGIARTMERQVVIHLSHGRANTGVAIRLNTLKIGRAHV